MKNNLRTKGVLEPLKDEATPAHAPARSKNIRDKVKVNHLLFFS